MCAWTWHKNCTNVKPFWGTIVDGDFLPKIWTPKKLPSMENLASKHVIIKKKAIEMKPTEIEQMSQARFALIRAHDHWTNTRLP